MQIPRTSSVRGTPPVSISSSRVSRSGKYLAHRVAHPPPAMADLKRQFRSINIDSLKSDSLWVIKLREKTEAAFSVRPCLWQTKVSLAVLKGDKNVCCIAGTGSGKTMTFWMPLLLREDGIQIVVVPLNVLGKQNVDQLAKAGIPAIAITGENATEENFKVRLYLLICNDRQLNQEDRTLRMANTVLSLQTQRYS